MTTFSMRGSVYTNMPSPVSESQPRFSSNQAHIYGNLLAETASAPQPPTMSGTLTGRAAVYATAPFTVTGPTPKVNNTRSAVYSKAPAVVVTDVDRPAMVRQTYDFIMCEAMTNMFIDAAKPKVSADRMASYLAVPEQDYGRRKANAKKQTEKKNAHRIAVYNELPNTDMVLPTYHSNAQQCDKRTVYASAMTDMQQSTNNNKPAGSSSERAAIYQTMPQPTVKAPAPVVNSARAAAYSAMRVPEKSTTLPQKTQTASMRPSAQSVSKTFSAGSLNNSFESLVRNSSRGRTGTLSDMTKVPSVTNLVQLHEDTRPAPVRLQRIINLGNIAQLQKFAC